MNSRAALATGIFLAIVGTFYLISPLQTAAHMSKPAAASSNGVPGLEFKLSQISKSPPSILVTLKNSHPTSTFTILKWATPLDPQATNLGVFKLIDADTGEKVNTDIIKIGRKTPPSREDLQEIEPNTEHSVEVIFDKPWMPEEPAKYNVKVEGKFFGIWDKGASEITESELDAYFDGPFDNTSFSSEQVLLEVE